jgi:centromeric protein E
MVAGSPEEEWERLYIKWRVPLEAKHRKLQLVNKLWTDPDDQVHIEESADILVTRLVSFTSLRRCFELNIMVPACRKPWLTGRRPISNMIRERAQLW